MGGTILTQADRVVGPHVGRRDVHQRADAHRATHVVAEHQERAAERLEQPGQGHAVHCRAHRVFAHPKCRTRPYGECGPAKGSPSDEDAVGQERRRTLDSREVRFREVRGAADQPGRAAARAWMTVDDALRVGTEVPASQVGRSIAGSSPD